jgi:signal transduction histidine kinase
MLNKLYVRIWLAVVMAVAVLTLLVAWAWRLAAEPPLRDVVVRNGQGQIIGKGHPRRMHAPEGVRSGRGASPDEDDDREGASRWPEPRGRYGSGPEFLVRMQDGQTVLMHLPRAPTPSWSRPPFGFFWMLGLVSLAVALATYPIIRKLTQRLEKLQDGVEQWGAGDLSLRIPEAGQDEVAFLAKRFNVAAERVETLVKSHESLLASQKSLLANASHELRSPLTRIRMGLELMGASPSPAFRLEIERNITELDQLIEEILLASRLDAREADMGTIESVDLLGLIAEECGRVDADLEVQQTPFVDGVVPRAALEELPVQGVAKLLRRAVRNLLENARRHTAGDVAVTLAQTREQVVIRVCDRGPGVPVALQERIFEPFYRLPGATERDGGVGLGLALVKSIVLRHGGTVVCENRPGGGACFVVYLPLSVQHRR